MKLSVFLLMIFIGCSSSKNIENTMREKEQNTQIDFEILVENQMGGYVEEEIRVISTEEELIQVYAHVNRIRKPGFSMPKVDFSKETIIAVFMGQKNTGGYAVTIDSVEEENNTLTVNIKETRPGPKDMVTMAITQPFCFVKIKNPDDKEIVLEK